MPPTEDTDARWRKSLRPEVYQALRHDAGEPPHTGLYEKTNTSGTYVCAGCGTPLFDSEQKILDDSGYAAFFVNEDEGVLEYIRTYSDSGTEHTSAVCAVCKGHIGVLGSTSLRKEEDYAKGGGKKCVHAYSLSLTLQKAFTPRNRPFSYVALLLLVAGGVAFGGHMLRGLVDTARHDNLSGEMEIVIADTQVTTTLVSARSSPEGVLLGDSPILVALDVDTSVLQLSERTTVDVLWLDAAYRAIDGQVGVESDVRGGIPAPASARLAFVARTGALPSSIFVKGVFVRLDTAKQVR